MLTGLRGRVAEQVERDDLTDLAGVRIESELDLAVQWCEDRLLAAARAGDEPAGPVVTLRERLTGDLGSGVLADRLLASVERVQVSAGGAVIAQGDRRRELFFLEAGTITVTLTDADGQRRRLRTMMAGTVIGEVGLYLEVPRSASVVADTDCALSRLSSEALQRLERDDPELAAALHRLLARHLASRLAGTLRTIEALGS